MRPDHPLLLLTGVVLVLSPVWVFLLDQAGLLFATADPLNVALVLASAGCLLVALSQRRSCGRALAAFVLCAGLAVAQFYAIAALVASTI